MLDDFRQQASSPDFEPEEAPAFEAVLPTERRFLGMTPFQRFAIALILLLVTCLLGSFLLLVTGRVVLPLL